MDRFRLADHQTFALEVLASNPRLGIFYEMGCGKTAIALTYIHKNLRQGVIRDALVVCPAGLVSNWEQSIRDMIRFEGFDTASVELLQRSITIVSYQRTWESKKHQIHHRNGAVSNKKELLVREALCKRWGCIVYDESHNIGLHSSNQTKTAIALARLTERRIVMSGTPVHGGGGREDFSKLYGQIQFLTAGTAFRSWSEFKQNYVISVDRWGNPRRYDVAKCRHLLQSHGIVCRLEDCFDMPGKIEQDVKCKLAEPTVYNDLKDGRVDKYGLDIENAGGQYTKMLQVCSGSMKVGDVDTMDLRSSKDDVLADIINGTEDPLVIFCQYRASVERCMAIARKAGRKATRYDGTVKQDQWKEFSEGRSDVIVCQYQRGSAGLNLQRAHHLVFYEPCMSALLMEQASGRIYRKGQDRKCVYYFLITPDTIEEKVISTVRSGVDVTDDMLRRWAEGEIF